MPAVQASSATAARAAGGAASRGPTRTPAAAAARRQCGGDEAQRQGAPAVVELVAVVEDSDRQRGGVELAGGGAAGQGVVEHSAPGVVAPEPVHHVCADWLGAEFFGDGGDDVVGQALVGGHGVVGVFVAADHPVAHFGDLAHGAVPGPAGVDGHGQPVDAGAGCLFGDDGRHLPAGVDPAVFVAVAIEHGAQQLALVLGHGQPEDPCAGGDFAGQGLVAVGHADAAFGGLQVVGQSADQIVGVDAVGGEAQVADDGARWRQQRVAGAAGQVGAQGAPRAGNAEAQGGPLAGDQCCAAGGGAGEDQAVDQDGAGVPGVQGEDGEHDGQGRAPVEADRHPQSQRLFEQDVGVDGGVVDAFEQLR